MKRSLNNIADFEGGLSLNLSFAFVFDAVDIQLYRAGDMNLHQICLSSADGG